MIKCPEQKVRRPFSWQAGPLLPKVLILLLLAGCGPGPEERLMEQAQRDPGGEAARTYVTRFPQGARAEAFRKAITYRQHQDAIDQAATSGSIQPLLTYLQGNPQSIFRPQIENTLKNMLFEKRSFHGRKATYKPEPHDPRPMLSEYLMACPKGVWATQARAAQDNLNWIEANLANTTTAYMNLQNPGGSYGQEVRARISVMETLPQLKPGMSAQELEQLLGPPDERKRLYPGANTHSFGQFYTAHYPRHGIVCSIRKTRSWEKVFSIRLSDPFMAPYQGVRLGMTREELLAVCDPLPPKKNHIAEEYVSKRTHATLQITWSGRYPGAGSYRDLFVSTQDQARRMSLSKAVHIPNHNGVLPQDLRIILVPLSGKKLQIKRCYGQDRVEVLVHSDRDLHGPFFVVPRM